MAADTRHSTGVDTDRDRCTTGKYTYTTKARAKRAAREQRARSLRAYRCPECGSYHVTKSRTRETCAPGTWYADVGAAMRGVDDRQRGAGVVHGFASCELCGGYHVTPRLHNGAPVVLNRTTPRESEGAS